MRRLVLILPWLIILLLGGTIVFLLTRVVRPWETRSVNAAPVVMAIRKIAQFSTVEVQISDVAVRGGTPRPRLPQERDAAAVGSARLLRRSLHFRSSRTPLARSSEALPGPPSQIPVVEWFDSAAADQSPSADRTW
jgi:hypothetical protein